MNKILIKILLVFLPFTNLIGQQYTNFNFTQSPNFQLTNSQKAQEELILEKKYSIEYVFENQHFVMYKYTYIARWVNSDKAIERNNKIYLSKNESASFVYQKARVIKPNGQISILKSEDIKEGKDEKSDYTYSYFALEGLEKASIIEFSSYEKTNPYYSGSIYYFQGSQKRYNQEFEIICPNHLEFAFKSLNNAPQIIVDTNLTEVNRWFIIVDSAQAITDKTYLYPDVVKMGILYKLDKNYNNNVKDITSYGPVSERIYTMINQAPSKSAKKKLNQINKELNLANINTDEEKIRLIENYVKQNFQIILNSDDNLSNLDFIFNNKVANDLGITKLLINLFKINNITYEMGITCDRSSKRFEPDFEAYLFLDHYVIYFPKIDKYLAPEEQFLRLGCIPGTWTNNYGLFIKNVKIGDLETGIGKIKFIEPQPHTFTTDIMTIKVNFSLNIAEPEITINKSSTGYYGAAFQPYVHRMDDEQLSNFKTSLAEMINEQITATTITLQNVNPDEIGVKPFIFEFTTTQHPFMEKAGTNYLFKVGELIGPQVEMYQETKRTFAVETDHTRKYVRKITFEIPSGYEIKNLNDININHAYGGNEPTMVFKSSYTLNNNIVEITCEEYYTKITYPVSEFEEYKKVINAAADFNKIVLVLKKV